MRALKGSRNVWLFGANMLLLICLLLAHVKAVAELRSNQQLAKTMDMRTYVARDPFAILTAENQAAGRNFRMIHRKKPWSFSVKQVDSLDDGLIAEMSISHAFAASCTFSDEETPQIRQCSVVIGTWCLVDLNADAVFDLRIWLGGRQKVDIWAEGKWEASHIKGEEDRRQLLSGEWYIFDANKGGWIREEIEMLATPGPNKGGP